MVREQGFIAKVCINHNPVVLQETLRLQGLDGCVSADGGRSHAAQAGWPMGCGWVLESWIQGTRLDWDL